MKNIENFEKNY